MSSARMSEAKLSGSGVIPVPEPELAPETMIARAEELIPMLRDQQEEAEERGYYSQAVHREFVRAGFSRILQPRRFGGYEFDLKTFFKTMVAISTGDPGTGWCLTLGSSHAWIVASHFSEQAQAEMFAPDGDFRAPHRAVPSGEAIPVAGGYQVSGRWSYASGIPYATWALFNAVVQSEDDCAEPCIVAMAVPRPDLTMLDDWGNRRVLGMNSSGSNSFVLDDVFVPDRFAVPFNWRDAPAPTPGVELHQNPMYLGRVSGPYHATLVVPIVGAARAALDEFRRLIMAKTTTFTPIVLRYQFHDDQRAYGLAMAMTDAAETILYGFGDQYMESVRRWASTGQPLELAQDARWWAMLQQAGGLAAGAVETLFHRATASSARKGECLERYFRDVAMYRSHVSAQQIDFAVRNAAFYLGASEDWSL
jgi:3-hydroxy-9,10-secoandrosta-1,3,5(10)-triene-9,17-dione monooxygenase